MKKLKKVLLGMLTATVMLLMLGLTAGAASKVTGISMDAYGISTNVVVKGSTFSLSVNPEGNLSQKDYADFTKKAKVSFSVTQNKSSVSSLKKAWDNTSKYCTAKKTGFVTFAAKATYKGKTYKTSCKVWITDKAPLKSVTWGSPMKLSNTDTMTGIYSNKGGTQNISATTNKGWKITSVFGAKEGEFSDGFVDSYDLNATSFKTTASYSGTGAYLDIQLQAEKDGQTYNAFYRLWRQKYSQYELTYKTMKKGTTIQLGNPNVLYRYNKKAKSTPIITKQKNAPVKYTIEFKSLKDLQKKMSTYRYGAYFVPYVSGEFRISGNKLIIKVPSESKVKLINPGKGTTLKKTV